MQPFRAISLKLFSVMVFITMISMIKATADTVPPGQAVFFRSAFAIPVICGWLMMRGELRTGLRAISPLGHLARIDWHHGHGAYVCVTGLFTTA